MDNENDARALLALFLAWSLDRNVVLTLYRRTALDIDYLRLDDIELQAHVNAFLRTLTNGNQD